MFQYRYLKQYRMKDMRDMMQNDRAPQKTSPARLDSKRAVVTGGTSGVGRAIVQALAARGAGILMVNRSAERSAVVCDEIRRTFSVPCDFLVADFSRLEEVHRAADRILDTKGPLDLLINNAGMHATRKSWTAEGHETVFCVNHLASFLLTDRLLERLKENPGARILQINSQGHRFGGLDVDDLAWKRRIYTGLRGYGASKTAQLLTVWEFADLLANTGVTINAMHPGAVQSSIGENNGPLYRWFKHHVLSRSLKPAAVGGEAVAYLASAPELSGVSGRFFNLTHEEKPAPHALDRELGRRVWEMSRALTARPAAGQGGRP